jgi:DNA repair protein RecO (recombination protein O)
LGVSEIITDAIVLHAMNYSETSRILRLATRAHGIQSVMARGARGSNKRFGAAVDLFAEGEAQFSMRAGRDLHTLARFDVQRSRMAIGSALARFDGASALAELVLRLGHENDGAPETYDALRDGLDAIADSPLPGVATLRACWRILDSLGVAPALDACVQCDRPIPLSSDAVFNPGLGGVLCDSCAAKLPGRRLPASARAELSQWLGSDDESVAALNALTERAHRRLLRVFVHAHLGDGRSLRAFDAWAAGSDLAPTNDASGASLA